MLEGFANKLCGLPDIHITRLVAMRVVYSLETVYITEGNSKFDILTALDC